MEFFNFLGQKKFYLQILFAVIASFVLLWIILQSLNSYTHHGEAISVPDYSGVNIDKIDSLPNEHHFRFILTDSIYDPKKKPGTVIMQNPLPYSKVKRNRKIYLTIIAKMPELIHMPNLVDLSLRQSLVTLEANGLEVNTLQYIPDFAENAVLAQLYNGDTILPDSLIQKGSRIDLILGKGYDARKIQLPFLIGMTQKEAKRFLNRSFLNVGEEVFLDSTTYGVYKIYMQEPSWDSDTLLNYGDFISLWYRSDQNFDFDAYIESLFPDTLAIDSIRMSVDSMYFDNANDSLYFEEL